MRLARFVDSLNLVLRATGSGVGLIESITSVGRGVSMNDGIQKAEPGYVTTKGQAVGTD